jgi:hypothetical protein
MGLLDRLFGRAAAAPEDRLQAAALQRAVELVEPKLALARDWQARLAPGVVAAIDCARDVARQLTAPHPLSPAAWADDPLLRAAFPTAAQIDTVLAGARDLQRWFRTRPEAAEAVALLGVSVSQTRQLGADVVDGRVVQDLAIHRVAFSGHVLRVVAADIDALQQAVGARVFNDLMLAATRRLAEAATRGKELNIVRAMLQARLRMLAAGERGLIDESADSGDTDASADPAAAAAAERASIERQLAELDRSLGDLGSGPDALDRQLELVRDTLLHAREALAVAPRRLRVDAMNRVLPDDDPRGALIEFTHVAAPTGARALVTVSVARRDLPSGGLSIAAVERTL